MVAKREVTCLNEHSTVNKYRNWMHLMWISGFKVRCASICDRELHNNSNCKRKRLDACLPPRAFITLHLPHRRSSDTQGVSIFLSSVGPSKPAAKSKLPKSKNAAAVSWLRTTGSPKTGTPCEPKCPTSHRLVFTLDDKLKHWTEDIFLAPLYNPRHWLFTLLSITPRYPVPVARR